MFVQHEITIQEFVQAHPIASPIFGVLLHALCTALFLPVGFLLSLILGFIFPQPLSTIIVVLGRTIGACVVYLSVRFALKDYIAKRKKEKGMLVRMQRGFEKYDTGYLLLLRVVPLFPFWLVNIAPALCKVSFRKYVWTTLVGIIPSSFVYTQAGGGVNKIFEPGQRFSFSSFLSAEMVVGLVGIMILAIIPLLVKTYMQRRS